MYGIGLPRRDASIHPPTVPPAFPLRKTRPRSFRYHLQLFEASLRAMASAEQSFLRVNAGGMLSMAHKVVTDTGA